MPFPETTPHPLLLGLRRSGLIAAGDRVLVAVSGGPDSIALLLALEDEAHQVVAAHYDHALQPGSSDVADHVRGLCERSGVEVLLERARAQAGADVVAIAHTADDVVEGAVLHLLRGCGLAGMRGMPARRGVFVRPLLSVWRSEVADYLQRRGIEALQDPANSNDAYARVRVRRDILPALERDRPGIVRRFHRASIRAAALQESISGIAGSTLEGGATRSNVAAAPEPVAAEMMRQLYARAGGAQP